MCRGGARLEGIEYADRDKEKMSKQINLAEEPFAGWSMDESPAPSEYSGIEPQYRHSKIKRWAILSSFAFVVRRNCHSTTPNANQIPIRSIHSLFSLFWYRYFDSIYNSKMVKWCSILSTLSFLVAKLNCQ